MGRGVNVEKLTLRRFGEIILQSTTPSTPPPRPPPAPLSRHHSKAADKKERTLRVLRNKYRLGGQRVVSPGTVTLVNLKSHVAVKLSEAHGKEFGFLF